MREWGAHKQWMMSPRRGRPARAIAARRRGPPARAILSQTRSAGPGHPEPGPADRMAVTLYTEDGGVEGLAWFSCREGRTVEQIVKLCKAVEQMVTLFKVVSLL